MSLEQFGSAQPPVERKPVIGQGGNDVQSHVQRPHFVEPLPRISVQASLPMTPIMPGAVESLRNWGLPDRAIDKLRIGTAQMHYDHVSERTAAMARRGAYVHIDESTGAEAVVIPDILDISPTYEGECSTLGITLLDYIHRDGLFQQVTATETPDGGLLNVTHIRGRSKKFFANDDAEHTFLGIGSYAKDEEPPVIIDPSLQVIDVLPESGYKADNVVYNPTHVPSNRCPSAVLSVSGLADTAGRDGLTLGASSDRRLVYEVQFPYALEDRTIKPLVIAYTDGADVAMVFDNNGDDIFINADHLTGPQQQETLTVFRNLQAMPLIHDQQTAERLTRERILHIYGQPRRARV